MENILKMMLFEIIYDELQLNEVDNYLFSQNILGKQINNHSQYPILSRYFTLQNKVTFERLKDEEKHILNHYIENMNNTETKKNLYNFLRDHKLKLLLPQTKESYLYWGPMNVKYMAPSDAIVLGFNYIEFSNKYDSQEQGKIIEQVLNNIQSGSQAKVGYKVAIIKYNEIVPATSEMEMI